MPDDVFLESLLGAVSVFLGGLADVSGHAGVQRDEESPLASMAHRLGDAPVTLGVPQNHGIAGIRKADPAFDLGAFLVRVGQMFAAYHLALDRGDLTPARRFIDETAWAELEARATKSGRRDSGPRALTIRTIRPMTAVHEDDLDLVRILITAEVGGETEPLCEYWEVCRKRGTLTKPGLDLTHCPNCGGPVDGDDPTRCAYCGTRLADPALDWVVRKITVQE